LIDTSRIRRKEIDRGKGVLILTLVLGLPLVADFSRVVNISLAYTPTQAEEKE
jgi:hypothetical protein